MYFDVTLTELWREAFGSYEAMVERGSDTVVADISAQFRAAARFDDELEIALDVERLGTTSMVARFAASRDGGVLVEGRTVYVFVDAATMRKQDIPDWVRDGLAPYVVA